MNSDSAIFCFGEENMNSYEETKKQKNCANIQFSAVFAPCTKTAQGYLRKLRLAPFKERRVLHCAASKTTLVEFVCSSALFLVSKLFNKAHCIDELSRGCIFVARIWIFLKLEKCKHGQLGLSSAFLPYQFPVHSYKTYAI